MYFLGEKIRNSSSLFVQKMLRLKLGIRELSLQKCETCFKTS